MDMSIIPSTVGAVVSEVGKNAKASYEAIKPVVNALAEEGATSAKNVGKTLMKTGANMPQVNKSLRVADGLYHTKMRETFNAPFDNLSPEDKAWAVADTAALIPVAAPVVKGVEVAAKSAKAVRHANKFTRSVKRSRDLQLAKLPVKEARYTHAIKKSKNLSKRLSQRDRALRRDIGRHWLSPANPQDIAERVAIGDRKKLLKKGRKTMKKKKRMLQGQKEEIRATADKTLKSIKATRDSVIKKNKQFFDATHLKAEVAARSGPYLTLQMAKREKRRK